MVFESTAPSSVTAYGRQYINDKDAEAQEFGLRSIYGDTDSIVALMGDKDEG